MPTPSSATHTITSSPFTWPVTLMVSLPSDGMAWRTAFSTSGWIRKGGTIMSSTSGSMSTSIATRSSPKRAISNVK